MPRPSLRELKPEYLDFIDLIRECRSQELGKIGPTRVPKDAIDSIASEERIAIYIEQLAEEGIFAPIKDTNPPAFCVIEREGDSPTSLIFNCRKSIEDIVIYKNSLRGIIGGAPYPLIEAVSWAGITIRFTTARETLISTAHNNQQRTMDFQSLGFVNLRNGQPNTAWSFLYDLARSGGEIPDLPNPVPDTTKKRKSILAEKLKEIFGMNSDPFFPYREEHTYKIKITLEVSEEIESPGEFTEN